MKAWEIRFGDPQKKKHTWVPHLSLCFASNLEGRPSNQNKDHLGSRHATKLLALIDFS